VNTRIIDTPRVGDVLTCIDTEERWYITKLGDDGDTLYIISTSGVADAISSYDDRFRPASEDENSGAHEQSYWVYILAHIIEHQMDPYDAPDLSVRVRRTREDMGEWIVAVTVLDPEDGRAWGTIEVPWYTDIPTAIRMVRGAVAAIVQADFG